MRTANKIILLTVFLVGAFAARPSIKSKLGQMNAMNLAEVEQGNEECKPPIISFPPMELPICPCNFSELPGLGNGVAQGFEQRAEAAQVATLKAVPDTSFTQICQSNCCECAESVHASVAAITKNKTFTILGSITILEDTVFSEQLQAAENSQSREEKDTRCVTNNQGIIAVGECINVTVCPPVGLGGNMKPIENANVGLGEHGF